MTSPAHDPTYLGAAATGWEEGYDAAVAHTAGGPVPRNPYTQLRDDRHAYVREQVVETYGSLITDDGDSLFDYAEVVAAILDAHTDWLAGQRLPQKIAEAVGAPQLAAGPTVLGWTADWEQTTDWRLARHITIDDANGSRHILHVHVTAGEHQ